MRLPVGGRDVQRLPCFKIDPGREDVDVNFSVRFVMSDCGPGVAVLFQSGPSKGFEAVECLVDFFRCRVVLFCPGDHSGRVLVF